MQLKQKDVYTSKSTERAFRDDNVSPRDMAAYAAHIKTSNHSVMQPPSHQSSFLQTQNQDNKENRHSQHQQASLAANGQKMVTRSIITNVYKNNGGSSNSRDDQGVPSLAHQPQHGSLKRSTKELPAKVSTYSMNTGGFPSGGAGASGISTMHGTSASNNSSATFKGNQLDRSKIGLAKRTFGEDHLPNTRGTRGVYGGISEAHANYF